MSKALKFNQKHYKTTDVDFWMSMSFIEDLGHRARQYFLTINDSMWFGLRGSKLVNGVARAAHDLIDEVVEHHNKRIPLQSTDPDGHIGMHLVPNPGDKGWYMILETKRPQIIVHLIGNDRAGYQIPFCSAPSKDDLLSILQCLSTLDPRGTDDSRLFEVEKGVTSERPVTDMLAREPSEWVADPDSVGKFLSDGTQLVDFCQDTLAHSGDIDAIAGLYNWALRRGVMMHMAWLSGCAETRNWAMHMSVNEAMGYASYSDFANLYGYKDSAIKSIIQLTRVVMHSDMHKAQVDASMWGRESKH